MASVRSKFETIPLNELIANLDAIGLPYAPINRPQDLTFDPHLQASAGLLDVELNDKSVAKLPALPIELSGDRLGVTRNIPKIGEHTVSVLKVLGYSDDEIELMNQALIAQ